MEINMFNDKYLKKVKPIREKSMKSELGNKIMNTFKENHNYEFDFVTSQNSKIDSTLLDIVSEIDKF